jgi:hypothetical protein
MPLKLRVVLTSGSTMAVSLSAGLEGPADVIAAPALVVFRFRCLGRRKRRQERDDADEVVAGHHRQDRWR